MSVKWDRVPVDMLCGHCRGSMRKGDPMFVFVLDSLKSGRKVKVRCVKCAGPAPPDLPVLIERMPEYPRTFSKVSKIGVGLLPFGFARVPGEEG